jgi:uncharacterized protein (TIGR03435 family)
MIRTILILTLCLSGMLTLQTAVQPKFEVASIKPGDPNSPHTGADSDNDRLTLTNVTLKRCIMTAYRIGPNQIVGGPNWLDSDRYVIAAKAEQAAHDDVMMLMLQSLLAERFKLVLHRETQVGEAYAMEVAKGGAKMEKAETNGDSTNSFRGRLEAKGTTMARLAEVLSRQMDLPVVDQTKLEGAFNFTLKWQPENNGAAAETVDALPSIFTALQEQLGLRLRATKAPIEMLVIVRAEHPITD